MKTINNTFIDEQSSARNENETPHMNTDKSALSSEHIVVETVLNRSIYTNGGEAQYARTTINL